MTRPIYLITEGVHDVAFLSRVLVKEFGLVQAQTLADVGDTFRRWLDSSFKWPHNNRIDRASVPAPEIYIGPGVEVALRNADGIDRIVERLGPDLEYFARGNFLDAIGVVLDADTADPGARKNQMVSALDAALKEADLPRQPRKTAVFVLPDGERSGSLEDILIPLGRRLYPGLFASADQHIRAAESELDKLRSNESELFKRPSGKKKALLSTVAAVLKPTKAIQATLKDHRWISKATLSAPELSATIQFLRELISVAPGDAPRP